METRSIPLSQNQVATVDASDYELLSQHVWSAWWNPCTASFYAVRSVLVIVDGKKQRRTIYMARQLLGLEHGDSRQGDHRNHDTLDCRRANLRVARRSQNQHNTQRRTDNLSGYKGVYLDSQREKWVARITADGKSRQLGVFHDLKLAALAYDAAARTLFGEFACTNFPDPAMQS